MNIKKNNLFKRDFDYPLFSRVRIKSDTIFFIVLEGRTFLFNKKIKIKESKDFFLLNLKGYNNYTNMMKMVTIVKIILIIFVKIVAIRLGWLFLNC